MAHVLEEVSFCDIDQLALFCDRSRSHNGVVGSALPQG